MNSQSGKKIKDKFGRMKKKLHSKKNKNNTVFNSIPGDQATPVSMPYSPCERNSTAPIPKRPERPKEAFIKYPHAIVKYQFQAQLPDEITAAKHEMLVLLKRVDPNWYYACTPDQERVGFIPVNFLDVRIDVPTRLNTTEPVVPPSFSNPPPATIMQEDPYKKVIDSCIYDIPKARPPTPTNIRNEDEVSTSSQVSPIPGGALLLVVQEFTGENSGDLSALSNEVIQWVEPGAKRGETPPEDWINCAKLNGVRGEFPGNLVRPLSDDKEIKTYLKNIPQAEAIKDYEGVPGQCIALEKGEVIYLSGEDATFCYGRSASGKQGKVPKTVCKVTVPLH